MKRLVKVCIIVMSLIYLTLLAAPAWSVNAPTHETIIFAFSCDYQMRALNDHTLRWRQNRHVSPV